MNERIDWYMRQHVDQGLDLAVFGDRKSAAKYMYEKGVPIHVAVRLLATNAKIC